MKFLFAILPVIFLFSCQPDSNKDGALGNGQPIVKKKVESLKVENGCQFISTADIANILGINKQGIKLRTPTAERNYSVCIWSWMQNGKRQSLFLRSERNPDAKKYKDKFDNFLNFSLTKGEKRYHKDGTEEIVTFEKIKRLGDKAIWSEKGRIIKWHYKNQFLFALSMDENNSIGDAQQDYDTLKRLAEIVNSGIE